MNNFAFDKKNFILLAIGMAIIIIGFILMSGSGSAEGVFNPDIFSARRIKVAPVRSNPSHSVSRVYTDHSLYCDCDNTDTF